MKRLLVAPTNIADIPAEVRPNGSVRRVLYRDEETTATTFVYTLPAGWISQYAAGNLVYHSKREEFFNLSGTFQFGDWYEFVSPGYVNHPPYWVHPSDERTASGVTLLCKYFVPNTLDFLDIPPDWDGAQFRAPGTPDDPLAGEAVNLAIDKLAWHPVADSAGAPLGFEAITLYVDEEGWTTWLMRVPAGWRGGGPVTERPGGDELYLVDGDLTVARSGVARLNAGSYYCYPDRIVDGGANDFSEQGCTAIRWTRDAAHLDLPAAAR